MRQYRQTSEFSGDDSTTESGDDPAADNKHSGLRRTPCEQGLVVWGFTVAAACCCAGAALCLWGVFSSEAPNSGPPESLTAPKRHCAASEFNLSGDVHLGFLQAKSLDLFDRCDNAYFKFVRCLEGSSPNASSPTCESTVALWTGKSHGDRESWLEWKGMINNRLTTMVAGVAGFRAAVESGGPYAYMKRIGVRPSFQGPDASFGLAAMFNGADTKKRVIDATWDNFNEVQQFSAIFNAGPDDPLQLRTVFGSGWAGRWRSLLLGLDQSCGMFREVCPCPPGAAWCTNVPCRVQAPHKVPRSGSKRFDPAAIYARQPLFVLSAAEVREVAGVPANVTLGKAEYDPCALGYVPFFWSLEGRRAVLQGLQRAAEAVAAGATKAGEKTHAAASEGCRHATFLYRLWGAIIAGMGPSYSGLAEPCEGRGTDGQAEPVGPATCSWTYDSTGHRGVVESWAPQGRLLEDYGAAVLTWPGGLGLRRDCEQVLGSDTRCKAVT